MNSSVDGTLGSSPTAIDDPFPIFQMQLPLRQLNRTIILFLILEEDTLCYQRYYHLAEWAYLARRIL